MYKVISKNSDSFGTLYVTVECRGNFKTLTFNEGEWPDALQLDNAARSAFGYLIGE